MAQTMENLGAIGTKGYNQLMEWNMFDQNVSASFFDPEWMFGVKGGFDVVIANPPYVEAKKLKFIASTLKPLYKVYSGTADFSVYFIELGLNVLSKNGILMYITTNKFFNTGYGKVVRSLLLDKQIDKIVNFEQVEVFEDVLVSSVVLGVKNMTRDTKNTEFTYQKFYKLKCEEFKREFVHGKDRLGVYPFAAMSEQEWSFADTRALSIKNKIESNRTKLSDFPGVAIYRGVTTGFNPAFIVSDKKKDELITADSKNGTIIKNLLQGRNIRRWYYEESDENLLFIPWHFPIHDDESISGASSYAERRLSEDYPILYDHLLGYKTELSERNQEETGIRYEWYALQRCAASYYPEFEKTEKIIWGLTADKWAYTLDTDGHYLPSNGYILTSTDIPCKYILGLLNSKVLHYYFGFIGVMTAGGAYTLKAATISALPFATSTNMHTIIALVEEILNAKEKDNNADVSVEEAKIDHIVYHLYNLTYDEVLVIDPETQITREEYENFKLN